MPQAPLEPAVRPASKAWHEVLIPVGSAVILAFLIELALQPAPTPRAAAARLAGSIGGILLAFLFGMFLGKRTWPRHGARIGNYLLRRFTNGRRGALVVLTDRPDFAPSTARRVLEVIGFSAGGAVILTYALTLLGVPVPAVAASSGLLVVATLWASFVLIPYWTFARMGLRRIDPVRWLIEPLSRQYAQRLRLSNGALLVVAFFALFTLFFRAGLAGDDALLSGARILGHIVANSLVVAATGVAYYARAEGTVFRRLEQAALDLGVRDGRGLTDGEFLPALSKSPAAAQRE